MTKDSGLGVFVTELWEFTTNPIIQLIESLEVAVLSCLA